MVTIVDVRDRTFRISGQTCQARRKRAHLRPVDHHRSFRHRSKGLPDGARGRWSRIRDDLTQREGWIATRFLSESETRTKAAPAKKEKKPEEIEIAIPVVPDSVLIQRIIAESLDSYPSSCACPYSRDRAGRRCGKRSAYNKPGGYAPVCFPGDVTKAMIEAFRSR